MGFEEQQRYFSAVFQDFGRYYYTVKENIIISSLGRKDWYTGMEMAAKEAGVDKRILSFPDDYNTQLGNLEDSGTGLSGGQWQRLSIARMLYRRAGICIWDEPAASMDALAESRLYKDFLHKRNDKCANIFVTHRVMESGRFVEQGNHAQLMQKKDGLYSRMFQAQKGMYE